MSILEPKPLLPASLDAAVRDEINDATSDTRGALNATFATKDSPAFTGTPTGLIKAHVGLANVDNTSDTAKPVSTAQQAALNGKADNGHAHSAADVTSGSFADARMPARIGATTLAVTDWNTAVSNGFYHGTSTAANAPIASNCKGVVTATSTFATQFVWAYSTDSETDTKTYRREMNGVGTWTSWQRCRWTEAEQAILFQKKADTPLNVRDYGAKGDGTTDDTTALNSAFTAAGSADTALLLPSGNHIATAGLPNLHAARIIGPGRITRDGISFYPDPKRGQTNTIYVRATGSDTNDGLTPTLPVREIRQAMTILSNYVPFMRGKWVVDVGAGTYKGGIRIPLTRNAGGEDFITIKGPATGGHPNVPTAIIDKAADTAQTWGILAEDGVALWLEDLKIVGGFAIGVDIRRSVYLQWRNCHIDGQNAGAVGLALNSHVRYYVTGGIIEKLTTNGISELFNVARAFNTVSSTAEQMIIRQCGDVGLQAKENCTGHLDYLTVEDCPTGIEMNGNCTVNVKSITLKRCTLGYANINSEVHNEPGIVWGTGADKCTREFISYGNSASELYAAGWVDSATARTTDVGHRPLIIVGASYTDATLTNPTTETNIASFTELLKAHRYNTKGKSCRVVLRGTIGGSNLTQAYRMLLRIGGTYAIDATIPSGAPAGANFVAEWDIVCVTDGNSQKVFSTLRGEGFSSDVTYAARTIELTSGDRTVAVSGLVTASAATDAVTMRSIEVWG